MTTIYKSCRGSLVVAVGTACVWFGVLSLSAQRVDASGGVADSNQLDAVFVQPPDVAKPWAYWWWLNANVTEKSITRDLEEGKSKGLGGFLLFDVTAYGHHHVPPPPRRVEFMSPQWRQKVRHVMSEAGRLGLEISVNLSTCGGALRAPWPTGDQGPKSLVWTSADVIGPRRVTCVVPRREGLRSWDIATLAVRIGAQEDSARPSSAAKEDAKIRFAENWSQVVRKREKVTLAAEVVDLTAKRNASGRIDWDAPEGSWVLLHFAYSLVEGAESDVDMLNAAAVEAHFDRMAEAIIKDAGPLAGKTLTHFYSVSWEGSVPSWTIGFEQEFEKYRGYRIRPFLPVLAGITIDSPEVSERFARDYGRTLSDCFMNNCYGTLDRRCQQAGVKWHSESGGPWRRDTLLFEHADALAFWGRNSMPQAEFWWPGTSEIGRSNAFLAANAAHIYGRPLASIEAFTHMKPHWSAYPEVLKPGADGAFCDGINRFIWHTFSASPPEFGKPGIVYFAGTHLNPNVTWWEQATPILTYLARCQTMLRQGRFVADVCCYRSDKNYETWSRGTRRREPFFAAPKGYAFDLVNTQVLVERLSVKEGNLVLPDGMQYRLLVFDPQEDAIPPAALRRVIELAKEGATIVLGASRPQRAPGLQDYPACDDEVGRLVAALWGDPGNGPSRRSIGAGEVIAGVELGKVLADKGILPDCAGPWEFNHRRADGLDVYFLAGEGNGECTFRISGREPELWDPLTGKIRDAVCWRASPDGRTTVPVTLPAGGSIFVIFRRPEQEKHFVSVSAPDGGFDIVKRTDFGALVQLWEKGRCTLETSAGRDVVVGGSEIPEPAPIDGPWDVSFAPGWGAPESVVFDQLAPWNEHSDEGIKYFSGTATYRKTFTLNQQQARGLVRLQLGEVKHVAQVRVNGKNLGVRWTAPWAVELTGTATPGRNTLEIDVTNVWANRLIGDAGLPENERLTKTNVLLETGDRTVRPFRGYGSTDPLLTSGLLGPVRLVFGRQQEISF